MDGIAYLAWLLWAEDNAIGWVYSERQTAELFQRYVAHFLLDMESY
jgi:hypothetical protein